MISLYVLHMPSNESDGLLSTLIDHLLEVIIYLVLVRHWLWWCLVKKLFSCCFNIIIICTACINFDCLVSFFFYRCAYHFCGHWAWSTARSIWHWWIVCLFVLCKVTNMMIVTVVTGSNVTVCIACPAQMFTYSCWISTNVRGVIWLFVVPMLLIILVSGAWVYYW